jgi:nicotinamidase-related amidase
VKLPDKKYFVEKSNITLDGIYDMLDKLPSLQLDELPADKTALVIIDMINGFVREGALMSPRMEALVPVIAGLSAECGIRGIAKLAFADNHTEKSPEFSSYPTHCMIGTTECELVDEIKQTGGCRLTPKNSTNGFLEEDFQKWLSANPDVSNFIITGDCTDICIQQFAVSLKAWFNMKNEQARIIVPVNAVETFDLGLHDGDLLNAVTLFGMSGNGVELVKTIEI